MDKIKNSRRCSPYLLKPLRTLDQALKDQAVIIQQHNITLLKQRGLPSPRANCWQKRPARQPLLRPRTGNSDLPAGPFPIRLA